MNLQSRDQSPQLGIKMSFSDTAHSGTSNDTSNYLSLKSAVWVNKRIFVQHLQSAVCYYMGQSLFLFSFTLKAS